VALGCSDVSRSVPPQVLSAWVCPTIKEGFNNIHMAKACCLQKQDASVFKHKGKLTWCVEVPFS
jgi:hypothetical protein